MGQYLGNRKIGTCESMYYMRIDEARELAAQGKRDNDGIAFKDYLEDGATRFRFPFPDEDNLDVNDAKTYAKHDKGFDIPAGGVEVNHDTICLHTARKTGGAGVNIFIPCLYSQAFKDTGIQTSTGGAGEQFLTVLFNGMRKAGADTLREKTIFACARCEQMQCFDDADIEKIKARAREYFAAYDTTGKNPAYQGNQGLYDHAIKIIERIK